MGKKWRMAGWPIRRVPRFCTRKQSAPPRGYCIGPGLEVVHASVHLMCGTCRDGAGCLVSDCARIKPPCAALALSKQQNISKLSTNPEFTLNSLQDGIDARELSSYKPPTRLDYTSQIGRCIPQALGTFYPSTQSSSIKFSTAHHYNHHACSSIQLVRFFVCFVFTYLVTYNDALNSSPSRIGSIIREEGAAQAPTRSSTGVPHALCAVPGRDLWLLNAGRARRGRLPACAQAFVEFGHVRGRVVTNDLRRREAEHVFYKGRYE